MKGKLCVITGATSGIGRATAMGLGALGADLILIGRNETRGKATMANLARLPRAGSVEFIRTDLSAHEQVRWTAAKVLRGRRPVDILINNAGARYDLYQHNAAGQELTFATNHLGHFLLTGLLLDQILTADAGRIITVSSGSHGGVAAEVPWAMTADNYDRRQAYAKSKLANILFAYELARRLTGTRAISCAFDPGGVASNFARNNGLLSWSKHLISHALRRELITPHAAADYMIHLLANTSCPLVNGCYYHRSQPARSSPATYDATAARALWSFSLALTCEKNIHERYAS